MLAQIEKILEKLAKRSECRGWSSVEFQKASNVSEALFMKGCTKWYHDVVFCRTVIFSMISFKSSRKMQYSSKSFPFDSVLRFIFSISISITRTYSLQHRHNDNNKKVKR